LRKVLLYTIIGTLLLITAYFLSRELSPLNLDKIEELILTEEIPSGDKEALNKAINELFERGIIVSYLSENAYVIVLSGLFGIFFLFVAIHLVIDKIFFKNFYETPSSVTAIRRGFLLVLTLGFLIFAKLNKAEGYLYLLIIIVPILLEIVVRLSINKKEVVRDEALDDPIVSEQADGKHISYEDAFTNLEGVTKSEDEALD
jgi:hypothetical protein